MRSIVITTKHHDGFCMFRTKTTDYNAYDATPCKRDFVKELAEAYAAHPKVRALRSINPGCTDLILRE